MQGMARQQGIFQWALSNGYQEGLTLDRIDVNGNYEPGNCRWVTTAEQMSNKRNTRYVEYEGQKYTLSEFAKKFLKIHRNTFYNRYKQGLPMDECMSEVKKII